MFLLLKAFRARAACLVWISTTVCLSEIVISPTANSSQLSELITWFKISYFEKLTIEDCVLASYKHSDNRLAAIVKMDSGDESLVRDIAMQVAANNPMAIYPDDIDKNILDKEKEIALATLADENKPDDIKEKIIIGKLNKFKMENALVEQPFIKDPDIKIKDLLGNSKILSFLRKKVGEWRKTSR